jgi:osmotically-inducible protein OsmY
MDSAQPTLVIKDSSITSSIKPRLASDPFKGLSHIDVDTDDDGVVTLKGKISRRTLATAQSRSHARPKGYAW